MYQNTNFNILCCNINKKITISRCVHVFVEVSTSKDGGKKNILIDLPCVRFFITKMSEKSKHYYSCLDLQYAKDDNSYVKKKSNVKNVIKSRDLQLSILLR